MKLDQIGTKFSDFLRRVKPGDSKTTSAEMGHGSKWSITSNAEGFRIDHRTKGITLGSCFDNKERSHYADQIQMRKLLKNLHGQASTSRYQSAATDDLYLQLKKTIAAIKSTGVSGKDITLHSDFLNITEQMILNSKVEILVPEALGELHKQDRLLPAILKSLAKQFNFTLMSVFLTYYKASDESTKQKYKEVAEKLTGIYADFAKSVDADGGETAGNNLTNSVSNQTNVFRDIPLMDEEVNYGIKKLNQVEILPLAGLGTKSNESDPLVLHRVSS